MRRPSEAVLTFMAEGEPPLFTRLNAGHPDVIVVDEADEIGVSGTNLRVHACPWTLTLNLYRLHWRTLDKKRPSTVSVPEHRASLIINSFKSYATSLLCLKSKTEL